MTMVNNNVTMHGSGAPAASAPDQQEKSNAASKWAQQFAAARGPETSGQTLNGGTGFVNSEISDESMEMAPDWRRAMHDLRHSAEVRALEAYKQRMEARAQRLEARELAKTYQEGSLAPVEAGIEAERDMLTKLVIAPGDELKEKARKVTLEALDKMETAIADYKKTSAAGPHTGDAEMRRIEELGIKLVGISKKLRDQLQTMQMAHELEALKRKVDELEKKQNPPSVVDIFRSIVNPISSITRLPAIATVPAFDQAG